MIAAVLENDLVREGDGAAKSEVEERMMDRENIFECWVSTFQIEYI